jgi:hypothetical protein
MLHAFSRKHRNLSVKVLGLWLGALVVLLLELRDICVTLGLGLLIDPHGPRIRMRRLPGLHLSNEGKFVWHHSCLCFLQKRTCN